MQTKLSSNVHLKGIVKTVPFVFLQHKKITMKTKIFESFILRGYIYIIILVTHDSYWIKQSLKNSIPRIYS